MARLSRMARSSTDRGGHGVVRGPSWLSRVSPRWLLPSLIVALSTPASALSQQISARISNQNAQIGEDLTLTVTLTNLSANAAPTPPATDEFDIQLRDPRPSVNRSSSNIFGRRTERVSYTYQYSVQPRRVGKFVIPSFRVKTGGKVYQTKPISVRVSRGPPGPFILSVVKPPSGPVYVGQQFTLELEVWARRLDQGRGVLSEGDIWHHLILANSKLGKFDHAQFEQPLYRKAKRATDDGVLREFHVFELDLTLFPTKPGPLEFGQIEMAYSYPLQVSRGVFGRVRLERTCRYTAAPELPAIMVKPLPEQGRPADYNGAIGACGIVASALPTSVPVGDPITLTLLIRGGGPPDRLSAPRLDQVAALTKDFEVPADALAGEVQPGGKRFTLTIRPLHEDVEEIPRIPMSYFDPLKGIYATAWSRPIPITVTTAKRLAIPAGDDATGTRLAPLEQSTEGLLANYTDASDVLTNQSDALQSLDWILLAVMPMGYAVTWLVQRRTVRLRNDTALRRRGRAHANARAALAQADGEAASNAIAAAVLGYIADRCNTPAGGMTRPDAARLLGDRGAPAEAIAGVDRLLSSMEQARFAGGGAREAGGEAASAASGTADEFANEAKRLIGELERLRW